MKHRYRVNSTQDMRSGWCALCGHDEVWQAPIKFSVVEPGENAAAASGQGTLATLVCAKCGHLQWFMENVASWRSAMLDSGHSPLPSLVPEEDPKPEPKPKPEAVHSVRAAVSAPRGLNRPPPPASHGPRVQMKEDPNAAYDVRLLSAEELESDVAHVLESVGVASSRAYALAFAAPSVVAEGIPRVAADRLRAALLACGAVASIEVSKPKPADSEPAIDVVTTASQPPPSQPVCRSCGKTMVHHQIMITQKGQLCVECYKELETSG